MSFHSVIPCETNTGGRNAEMVGFISFRFDKFSINLDPKEKENNSHGESRFKIANRFKIEIFF